MQTSIRSLPSRSILLFFLYLFCTILFLPSFSSAESRIPTELQQWIPWVLYDQEEKLCTIDSGDSSKRYCTWPSKLELGVHKNGASFSQEWLVETRSLILLPGNSPFWPLEVQVNGKDVLISKNQDRPAVWMDPGTHTLTGKFSWATLPESILIPPKTGIVHLTLLDKKVTNLQLDKQGRLWFRQKKEERKNSEESLSVQVSRKIKDGVPLLQQLHIQLIVSGSPRQVTLGLKTGNPLIPLLLRSPLPARLDRQGRLQIQVRPGQWQIQMTLRNSEPLSPQVLTMGEIDGIWPSEEIWVYEADPQLRQIEIGSVLPVDPSRTTLPEKWKSFPAYLIKSDGKMTLTQKNRGNPNPVPNRLKIHRKIWLDEQGSGLTTYDTISGTMTRGWRLNVDSSQILGKVDVEGNSRLITRLTSSDKTGVEVRQGSLSLHAESRIQKAVAQGNLKIPALGWDHNFQKLSMELNLPPGWKLLTTSGVDHVSTWLNRWTLLDIFLVLIIGLATSKILGLGWGSVAILLLTLCFHQHGSPRYLWLPLLGLLAIQQVITAQTGKRICRIASLTLLVCIIIGSVPYMINEIRVGIYPQLEHGNSQRITNEYQMDAEQRLNSSVSMEDEIVLAEFATIPSPRSKSIRKQAHYSMGASQSPPKRPKSIQIDPQDMIQTGPGLPDWQWNMVRLNWNGPVSPEQTISLLFLTPFNNTILAFVRVFLLTLLLGGFLKKSLNSESKKEVSRKGKSLALCFLFLLPAAFSPNSAAAEVPAPEILEELQSRLLMPPKCGNQCATINSCLITADNDLLTVELRIDSLIKGAIALPGKDRFFDQITINKETAPTLRLNALGNALIRLDPGSHIVVLKKTLLNQNKLSFSFPVLPEQGQTTLNGWSINGLHENGRLDKQLSLSRIAPAARKEVAGEDASPIRIAPFVRVERTLHLGLKWTVSTKIIRLSSDNVIALDMPLLPGEHVTTASLQIRKQHVRINMGAKQNTFIYHSAMDPVDLLTLNALQTSSWTEIWFLDVSPIWHVETSGLPEINQTNPAGKRYPEYHPYPGESLQLTVSRPQGVAGPTMTINRSKRVIKPGLRTTESSLFLSLNASRALQHSITLPPDIDLQKTLINGKEFPLQLNRAQLLIPIKPGQQNLEIGWRSKHGVATKLVTETVDIGLKSVNSSIEMKVPSSRWILLTGGPRIGPAVLFWGEMLVIILIALLLGRVKLTPLNSFQWLLLSLGLSQVPTPIAAIVVAWLLLLGLRKKRGHEVNRVSTFNVMQVFLAILTLAALAALFFAIQQGLLGHPDMQIGGNGSSGHSLRWYQDRIDSELPTAWVLTVPLLAYRISMLLWALWLAIALLRWLRWGWDCFSESSVWKKAPPKPKKKKIVRKRKIAAPAKTMVPRAKIPAQAAPPEKPRGKG